MLFSGTVRENVLMGLAEQYERGTEDEDYPTAEELETTSRPRCSWLPAISWRSFHRVWIPSLVRRE